LQEFHTQKLISVDFMNKRKLKKKEFKITIKSSSLPEEEKRKLLFECFDILLSKQDSLRRTDFKKE